MVLFHSKEEKSSFEIRSTNIHSNEVENNHHEAQINCQKSINLVSFIPLELFLLESL